MNPMQTPIFARNLQDSPTHAFGRCISLSVSSTRKKMRRREELTREQRNTGPDICIRKGRRRIWIEGIATGTGNADNLDQVPDLFAANADEVQNAPRRQIELRITAALRRKAEKFERYCHGGKPARSATRTRCVHSQDVLGPGFDTSLGGHLETSAQRTQLRLDLRRAVVQRSIELLLSKWRRQVIL